MSRWVEVGDRPRFFAISGLQMSIAPRTVGGSYPLRMIYYADVPKLSGSAPCTAVLQRYADLYLYGTLAGLEGFFVGDQRIPVWKQQYLMALADANRSAARRG